MAHFILMNVDGSDTDPRSVHRSLEGARDAALADALRFTDDDDDYRIEVQNAHREGYEFARGEAERMMRENPELFPRLDFQWESGVGSYDYRIVEVK